MTKQEYINFIETSGAVTAIEAGSTVTADMLHVEEEERTKWYTLTLKKLGPSKYEIKATPVEDSVKFDPEPQEMIQHFSSIDNIIDIMDLALPTVFTYEPTL